MGRDFGGRKILLDAPAIERYLPALGQRHALYREFVPALVLHSECYENLQWYLANIWGNLHARQEWEFFRQVPIGSRVHTRGFLRERYRKRGRPLAPLRLQVAEPVCMAFSGPTENYHTNRAAAQALGFPDIVMQGMLPISLLSELLTREYGRGWLAGGKMDVRLVNVLWADEIVEARAEETAEVPEVDRTRIHLDVWVQKEVGTKIVIGNASALR